MIPEDISTISGNTAGSKTVLRLKKKTQKGEFNTAYTHVYTNNTKHKKVQKKNSQILEGTVV